MFRGSGGEAKIKCLSLSKFPAKHKAIPRDIHYTRRFEFLWRSTMFNRDSLDQLAQQIGGLFNTQPISEDVQRNLRALIQSALSRMDIVTRDEFDAQAAVLAQTRAKLDQLEIQLNELAQQLDSH